MKKLTVALLSGGISSEREVSLHSGDQVYEALDKEKYNIQRYDPKIDLARLIEDAAPMEKMARCRVCLICSTFPIRVREFLEVRWP